MTWQRTIGIDLALEGKHAAIACDGQGKTLNTKAFKFTTNLQEMEKLIAKFIPEETNKEQVAIAMEPTSNAWLNTSAFFIARGYSVFIIKTQKSHALRKFFKKHAKTDPIDAQTLARMPLVDPEGLNQLTFPNNDYFSLQKFIKFRENTVKTNSKHKNRIYAHFQLLNPKVLALLGDDHFTYMGKAFQKKYANPLDIQKDGFKKFKTYLNKKAFGTPNQEMIKNMFDVSVNIARFHQDIIDNNANKQLPYDMDQVQSIIKEELSIIEFLDKKRCKAEKEIKKLYDKIDPNKTLKGIKGFGGDIIAPGILAFTGNIKRFKSIRDYLGFIGLVPKTSQSVKPAREGLRITKASSKLLKKYFCIAADVARKFDVEFAHKYKILLDRGLHHNQAICALANMLARRIYSLLKQKEEAIENNDELKLKSIQYELRDLNHHRITDSEALKICKRDYPGKKEQARRLKQKKEKVATASGSGQSPLSEKKSQKGNSTISSDVQPPLDTMILTQQQQCIQELIDSGELSKKAANIIKEQFCLAV
jgi:transposase